MWFKSAMIIVSEVPKAIYNTVFNNDDTKNVFLLTENGTHTSVSELRAWWIEKVFFTARTIIIMNSYQQKSWWGILPTRGVLAGSPLHRLYVLAMQNQDPYSRKKKKLVTKLVSCQYFGSNYHSRRRGYSK